MGHARILIADDDPDVRDMLHLELRLKTQWTVEIASDGEEAWQHLISNRFDAALLDIKMPGRDGLAILKDMKHQGICTQIVVITGLDNMDIAIEAMRLGVKNLVRKPFQTGECIQALQLALNDPSTQDMSPSATVEHWDAFIQNARHRPDFSIVDLCVQFNVSRAYIARLLRQELRTTFKDRLLYWRIARAKHLLSSTDLLIYQVAEECGFKNHNRLDEAFRRVVNMSPSDYRKRYGRGQVE